MNKLIEKTKTVLKTASQNYNSLPMDQQKEVGIKMSVAAVGIYASFVGKIAATGKVAGIKVALEQAQLDNEPQSVVEVLNYSHQKAVEVNKAATKAAAFVTIGSLAVIGYQVYQLSKLGEQSTDEQSDEHPSVSENNYSH